MDASAPQPETIAPEDLAPRRRWYELSPLNKRRVANFRANRRALWSLRVFSVLFVLSLFAEFIANDRPLLVSYGGEWLTPITEFYPETRVGDDFETEADYTDPVL